MNHTLRSATLLTLLAFSGFSRPLLAQTRAPTTPKPFHFEPSLPLQTDADRKARPGDKSAKAIVNAFNQMGFIDHDPIGAIQKYVSPDFIERSPEFAAKGFANDKEGALSVFKSRGWKPTEGAKDEIYMVLSDGDIAMVYHHVIREPNTPGFAFVDLFRVREGLIVEHWTVGQPMPTDLTAKHSMF